MKIWKIETNKCLGYDCFWAHIIEAENVERVRSMAAERSKYSDDPKDIWLNEENSTVTLIGNSESEEECFWLSDFHAG